MSADGEPVYEERRFKPQTYAVLAAYDIITLAFVFLYKWPGPYTIPDWVLLIWLFCPMVVLSAFFSHMLAVSVNAARGTDIRLFKGRFEIIGALSRRSFRYEDVARVFPCAYSVRTEGNVFQRSRYGATCYAVQARDGSAFQISGGAAFELAGMMGDRWNVVFDPEPPTLQRDYPRMPGSGRPMAAAAASGMLFFLAIALTLLFSDRFPSVTVIPVIFIVLTLLLPWVDFTAALDGRANLRTVRDIRSARHGKAATVGGGGGLAVADRFARIEAVPEKGRFDTRSHRRTAGVFAALTAGMLLLQILPMLLVPIPSGTPRWHPPHREPNEPSGPEQSEDPFSTIFMDVARDTVISNLSLDIDGDIVVESGATLKFVDCRLRTRTNILTNGSLVLQDTAIEELPAERYTTFSRHSAPSIDFKLELEECTRAVLLYSVNSTLGADESVSVYALRNSTLTEISNHTGRIPGWQNVSLDLAAYCGRPVTVRFLPEIESSGNVLYMRNLRLETDPSSVAQPGLKAAVERFSERPGRFHVVSEGGRVSVGVCNLSLNRTYPEVFTIANGSIDIRQTSFRSDNRVFGPAVNALRSEVDAVDTVFGDFDGIHANGSTVSVDRCRFEGSFNAVTAEDTDLSLQNSTLHNVHDGCLVGGGQTRRACRITSCALNYTSTGITVFDSKAEILGNTISSEQPLRIIPWDTDPAAIRAEGNQVAGEGTTAVAVYSCAPVDYFPGWVEANTLSMRCPVARMLLLRLACYNDSGGLVEGPSVSSSGTWSAAYYDAQLRPSGTGVGNATSPDELSYGYEWPWSNPGKPYFLPVERVIQREGNISRYSLEKTVLDITNGPFMAEVPLDMAGINGRPAALDLNITLHLMNDSRDTIDFEYNMTDGNISFNLRSWFPGRQCATMGTVLELEGARLFSSETLRANYEKYSFNISIEALDRPGKLVLADLPVDFIDDRPDDNHLEMEIVRMDSNLTIGNRTRIDGIWLLEENVSLRFENCTVEADGYVWGRSTSSIAFDNATVLVEGLETAAGRTRISESRFWPQDFVDFPPRDRDFTALLMRGGELDIEGSVFGNFPGDKGAGAMPPSANFPPESLELYFTADNATATDSTFNASLECYLIASARLAMDNVSLKSTWIGLYSGPELTIQGSRLEAQYSATLTAANATLLDNDITGPIWDGFEVQALRAVLEGNRIFLTPISSAFPSTCLKLEGCEDLYMANNTLAGGITGLLLDSPIDYTAILARNTIDVSAGKVVRMQNVRIEISDGWLANRSWQPDRVEASLVTDAVWPTGGYPDAYSKSPSEVHAGETVWALNLKLETERVFGMSNVTKRASASVVLTFWATENDGSSHRLGEKTIQIQVRPEYRWVEYLD